ncbi:MAG: hypothetical protein ACLP50_08145 [Solirubrobacteraceae bacterium]
MKLFIAWSGHQSKAVAVALREWLPYVLQSLEPFVSEDIPAGDRWGHSLAVELDKTNFGILCLTRENRSSAWLNFEAGALAKHLGHGRVVPLTIDLEIRDIPDPIRQFQCKPLTKPGVLSLLQSLKEQADSSLSEAMLADACDTYWPRLASKLTQIRAEHRDEKPHKNDRDLLEEILACLQHEGPSGPLDTPIWLTRRAQWQAVHSEEFWSLVPPDSKLILSGFDSAAQSLTVITLKPLSPGIQDRLTASALRIPGIAQVAFRVEPN